MDGSESRGRRERTLRDLNTDDLLQALGLRGAARGVPPLRRLFDGPSRLLARRLLALDDAVGEERGPDAARALLASWGVRLELTGAVPMREGPRLFVANHPGLGDFLALLAALGSPDLRVVARERPLLAALPALSQRLIVVPERGGLSALRRVTEHLRGGGAVLTFPAGRIEPDPAWTPTEDWSAWSASTAFWARSVPGLNIQPLLVAGVRDRRFVDPWFARVRRPENRDWTAAVAQLVLQMLWARPRGQRIEVAVGEPVIDPAALAPLLVSLSRRVRR